MNRRHRRAVGYESPLPEHTLRQEAFKARLSNEEREALAHASARIDAETAARPKLATRRYYSCEVWPDNMLFPHVVRNILHDACAGLKDRARAAELEAYAADNININGRPFTVWEADPEVLKPRGEET